MEQSSSRQRIDLEIGMVYIKWSFHLVKVDIILKKSNGFIWIETLVSLSIVMLLATTIIPIYTTLQQEKRILHDRSLISLYLYDELQREILEEHHDEIRMEQVNISDRIVTIQFTLENEYIKGCVSWENVKERTENLCLYGIPKT